MSCEEPEPRWWRHMIREHETDPVAWRYWRMFATRRQSGLYRWGTSRRADLELSAEVLIWHRKQGHGVGWSVTVCHDGDLKVAVHAGRIGSMWLKAGHVLPNRLTPGGYRNRETSLVFGNGGWPRWMLWRPEHEWSSRWPWWLAFTLNHTAVWGRVNHETTVDAEGEAAVPMPEGVYRATWKRQASLRRHVRWPGTWLDRVKPKASSTSVWVDVEGGIPVWGKGENSWDCGMDAIHGTGGATVEEAVANLERAVHRDRKRRGGPNDLPYPMTSTEAEEWAAHTP